MFKTVAPEQAGISSKKVTEYILKLERRGLSMHSLILARGFDIFCEAYWAPFTADMPHRMYSTTKSYVSIAVGELAAEGKLCLDDKIVKYFPDKLPEKVHPFLENTTIRQMLKMQSSMFNNSWFGMGVTDRVEHYFKGQNLKPADTYFDYDSSGSFVLGALVERVSGMKLLEYLRKKCLNEIGFSKQAFTLDVPGGHTWGDSALLCTSRDQLAFGRLLANGGEWDGRQLLSREYIAEAIKKQTENHNDGVFDYGHSGYGYQIWNGYDGSFMFIGMHDQLMIYHPKTDIILVCTAGDWAGVAREIIIDGFFEKIIASASEPLSTDNDAYNELKSITSSLTLYAARGASRSDFEAEISGKKFIAEKNPMGISEFALSFDDEGGSFDYINAQGAKSLRFCRCKNAFQQFPQTGYSKDIGSYRCEGNTYKCAVSAAWVEERKLSLTVQIIDDYIGILNITIGFSNGYAYVVMNKFAEDFLDEYCGRAIAKAED